MQELLIPRKKYIQSIEEISNCPDCNNVLLAENCVVILYGKSDIDEGDFMTNVSGSHFCTNCPTVIFENETIEQTITLSLRKKNWFECDVLGLVDLDAVPEEKKHLPFGEDNPIPIVTFLNDDKFKIEPAKPQLSSRVKNETKVGRNEPCPCGSGKKHKKCCL